VIYRELFSSWADVQKEFATTMPEPDRVLMAYYGYESYSGEAGVVYQNGTSYYVVMGGHCSCHGLEDQFTPTEYESKELLLACLKKESYYDNGLKNAINDLINELEA
jgi:hypothetical protein